MAFRLSRLRLDTSLTDPRTGRPTPLYIRWWQALVEQIEGAIFDLTNTISRVATVEVDVVAAQTVADQALQDAAAAQADADAAAAIAATKLDPADIGLTVQGYDADLAAIAAILTTTYGRGLLALADAAALRTNINVASGATANLSDAALLDRGNHTGTQPITTISDYTTGTWTPTVTAGSGALTSYTAIGSYTKIGRLVTATVEIEITNNGTGAIGLSVSLPFQCNGIVRYFGAGRERGLTGDMLQVGIDPGATTAGIQTYNNGYPGGTNSRPSFTIAYHV